MCSKSIYMYVICTILIWDCLKKKNLISTSNPKKSYSGFLFFLHCDTFWLSLTHSLLAPSQGKSYSSGSEVVPTPVTRTTG